MHRVEATHGGKGRGQPEGVTVYGKKQASFEDYDGFINKFKPKKTTDDCYTPEPVYDCPTPLMVTVEEILRAKAKHDERDRRALRRLRKMRHA